MINRDDIVSNVFITNEHSEDICNNDRFGHSCSMFSIGINIWSQPITRHPRCLLCYRR